MNLGIGLWNLVVDPNRVNMIVNFCYVLFIFDGLSLSVVITGLPNEWTKKWRKEQTTKQGMNKRMNKRMNKQTNKQ